MEKNLGKEFPQPGLERVAVFAEKYIQEIKVRNIKVVTIAGTNGKGSVTNSLSVLAKLNQKKGATWMSPHLITIRERFIFDNQLSSYEELETIIQKIWQIQQAKKIQLTYYEFLFICFLEFALDPIKKVELLFLEVGLGGRLDAVNVLDADFVAITSISRDHENILGRGYANILREKLGVIRKKTQVFSQFDLQFLKERTANYFLTNNFSLDLWTNLEIKESYKVKNYELAVTLYRKIDASAQKFLELSEIETNQYLYRMNRFTQNKQEYHFVGAHNIDGVRAMLAEIKATNRPFTYALISFSQRSEAEAQAMLKMVGEIPYLRKIYLTSFDHFKAMAKDQMKCLSKLKLSIPIEYVDNFELVIEELHELQKDEHFHILVAGSYYFLGMVELHFLSQ
ncbi:MAG: hypothetical protein U0T83_09385 [Bacteriovoracaceae bacterium]